MIALDASVLFGMVERNGRRVRTALAVVRNRPGPYVTTEACLAEAMHLAGSRLGWRAQDEIWLIMRSVATTVVHTDSELVEFYMRKYRDVPMDFADATLVAFATEESRVRVATFDSDFLAYRRDDGTPIPLVDDRLLGWE